LGSCYRRALEIAGSHALCSISFPAISTGAYGYPIKPAAEVAVRAVRQGLQLHANIEQVLFCCFSPAALTIYEDQLARL
jgi:O-acetyl-ADP-ribose deacetylase